MAEVETSSLLNNYFPVEEQKGRIAKRMLEAEAPAGMLSTFLLVFPLQIKRYQGGEVFFNVLLMLL